MSTKTRSPIRDDPNRQPGESARQSVDQLLNDGALSWAAVAAAIFAFLIVEWCQYLLALPPMPWFYTVLGLLGIGFCAWRMVVLVRRAKDYRLGEQGERLVADVLDDLRSSDCIVLHDVIADRFNLDHVLVASRGVFVIETKTRRKPAHANASVVFDGKAVKIADGPRDSKPVDQLASNCDWLQKTLYASTGKRYAVRGILVYPGWWVESRASREGARLVAMNPKLVPGFIRGLPESLPADSVRMAALHLRKLTASQAKAARS